MVGGYKRRHMVVLSRHECSALSQQETAAFYLDDSYSRHLWRLDHQGQYVVSVFLSN